MFTALLITLREGLEAALVIAVVMSFLGRTGAVSKKRFVWLGAAAAAGLSLLTGALLVFVLGEMSDESSEIVEIAMTPLAVGALTYMILWMKKYGAGVKGGLEEKAQTAARSASSLALVALAFAAVGREGLETVLFLFTGLTSAGGAETVIGAVAGLALAALLGAGFYRGSYRLDLRRFFNVTGILLIVMAAGVLVNVMGELKELGLPAFLTQPIWDLSAVFSEKTGPGAVLKSLLGYQADPSLVQLTGYGAYLSVMLWLYLKPHTSSRRLAAGKALPASE